MSPYLLLSFIVAYFILLFTISFFTSRQNNTNAQFFIANKKSKWYMIAFGMIGTTMSGVTFISVPGKVSLSAFSYYQFVIGNAIGFLIVIYVLLPLYYRLNLNSIYSYIGLRFGKSVQKVAASLFLLSRTLGSAARLYLVTIVLQKFVFDQWHIPFFVSVLICLIAIWAYTIKGGLKTIIWTDTIQTFLLLLAMVLSICFLLKNLNIGTLDLFNKLVEKPYTKIFFTDDFLLNNKHVLKNLFGGVFVTIAMVGLDQDIMQKNLSLPNIKEAQKNLIVFVCIFLIINLLFLIMGGLLKMYIDTNGIVGISKSDYIYPVIALQYLSSLAGICFMLGLTAATFATTDSALTALTTSFCIDILEFSKASESAAKIKTRMLVHTAFCGLIFISCLGLYYYNSDAIVDTIFIIAGYTYAPLLSLYYFGIMHKRLLKPALVPWVCCVCPLICFFTTKFLAQSGIYVFGVEVIVLNAAFCLLGLYSIQEKEDLKYTPFN